MLCGAFFSIAGKYDIIATDGLVQHFGQEPEIVRKYVDYRNIIAQRIFQTYPACGVAVNFLGQRIHLDVRKSVCRHQTLEDGNAIVIGGIVHDNQFIVADQARYAGSCIRKNFFKSRRMVTYDKHDG